MPDLDLVVDLGERHPVIKIMLCQEVDQLGQGSGLGLGATVGVDPHQGLAPVRLRGEGRALLILPGGDDDVTVVPAGRLEQGDQVGACVNHSGLPHVVPPDSLAEAATQRAEPQRRRVEATAEQQIRHRADPDRVVAALDRLGERRVEVLEWLAWPGADIPGEVPECDRQALGQMCWRPDGR